MNFTILTAEEAQYLHEHGEVLILRGRELYMVKPHGHKEDARIPGSGLCHVGYACKEGSPRLYAVAEEQKSDQARSNSATFSGSEMVNGVENAICTESGMPSGTMCTVSSPAFFTVYFTQAMGSV